jgi:ketosteroid isomerase-like protein
MTAQSGEVTVEFLEAFADAWNRHNVDDLMSFMTDDCIFESSGGENACGTRFEGAEAVRKG